MNETRWLYWSSLYIKTWFDLLFSFWQTLSAGPDDCRQKKMSTVETLEGFGNNQKLWECLVFGLEKSIFLGLTGIMGVKNSDPVLVPGSFKLIHECPLQLTFSYRWPCFLWVFGATNLEGEIVQYWRKVFAVCHRVMHKLNLSILRPLFRNHSGSSVRISFSLQLGIRLLSIDQSPQWGYNQNYRNYQLIQRLFRA